MSVTRNICRELISRKLHITYSFVIQRIAWKIVFGIIFLENLISKKHEIVFSELISQCFLAGVYSGGAQGAERHRTVIPGDTRMSFPWVKVPPLKLPDI